MSCNDLRCRSITTHNKPIGNTTQPIARSNPTGRLTRCDRRPTTRRPIVTAPAVVSFPSDSFWRGERHRLCDRPELVTRLVDELIGIGIEQIVLIGAAPPPALPHAMRARPIDLRGRIGELIRSIEGAAMTDAAAAAGARLGTVFVIRPDHNPIGPFAFAGVYDEASDRHRSLAELIEQGYADAYRHFIDVAVVEN